MLLRGRKVCGILIEQARGTVVGIGLNVFQTTEALTVLAVVYLTLVWTLSWSIRRLEGRLAIQETG